MTQTYGSIQTLMEQASESLARLDYVGCERRCVQALALTRAHDDWAEFARVLLPLQEARRQRRLMAVGEGRIRLGTAGLRGEPAQWLSRCCVACLVVTRPHDAQTVQEVAKLIRQRGLYAEVLLADPSASAGQWVICSFSGVEGVRCTVQAPPTRWVDRWLEPDGADRADRDAAAAWFVHSSEMLGDAALASVGQPVGDAGRVDALLRCLEVVADHEIVHQELWKAARAMIGQAA